ncbi:30S ribosome-binding factor RbfA [Gemmata sp.]|uniref:30S ribosome-binding factor RbfA n=1 Tax=Gemmata sp. TaxID=1914242 RepID=UPI003F718312
MKSHRIARVSEVIRETAANAILFEIKDPRVKNVTVTRAEVSGDLQHAKVFVSVMGSEKEQNLTMHGLKSAAGFVQTRLASQLTSRYVPHITFVIDEGVKRSVEISRMIREESDRIAADHAANGTTPAGEDAQDAIDDEGDDTETDETDDHAEQPGPADGSANRPD